MAFFKTVKVPTTNIFQNHLDEIHHTIESFCKENKKYQWLTVNEKTGKAELSLKDAERYISKNRPESLLYYIVSKDRSEIVYIEIKDGVTINIKNGKYALFGLFHSLLLVFDSFKIPLILSFTRRYWIFLTPLFLGVSGILLCYADLVGWGIALFVATGLFLLFALVYIFDDSVEPSDYILDTKISYRKYSNKLGVPIHGILTSATSIVTFAAGLATIVSSIILIVQSFR